MNCKERVRGLREEHDYKKKELCSLLHIAQTTYSDYETGKIRIPVECMIELARLYDVDLNYMCDVTDEKKPFPRESAELP